MEAIRTQLSPSCAENSPMSRTPTNSLLSCWHRTASLPPKSWWNVCARSWNIPDSEHRIFYDPRIRLAGEEEDSCGCEDEHCSCGHDHCYWRTSIAAVDMTIAKIEK